MLRVRQDWFDELDEMQRQMERFLEHFTSCKRPAVMFSTGVWQPLVDVYETPEEVVVVAELAGVAQGDVSIVLHNNTLLLRKAALPIMKRVPIEIVVEAEERQE
jgi:HSP20 family protein